MHPRKKLLKEFVESLPEAGTTERNWLDMKCWIKAKGFAYWLEEGEYAANPVILLKMPLEMRDKLVEANCDDYGVPKIKIHKNWLEVRLDPDPENWDEILSWVKDAYVSTAPKLLVKKLNQG